MRRIREVSETGSPRDQAGSVEAGSRLPSEQSATIYGHPEWKSDYPWLVQGITSAQGDYDLRLFGRAPVGGVMERWDGLRQQVGLDFAVHARQVHGRDVAVHQLNAGPGLTVLAECDGHATNQSGILLTVAVADCVPVYLVDPDARVIAVVHAGWRGVVAGILQSGVDAMKTMGAAVDRLRVHLGPHICERCYEVGPEVHGALGFPEPDKPTPVSLASALSRRASDLGVGPDHLTASALCTRCDEGLFYSHRGGGSGRQVGILGMRPS